MSSFGRRRGGGDDKPPPDARNSALRLLTRREHSSLELKRKLAERGVEADAAGEAIDSLASHDLQSDTRYAEQLIRTRVNHGYGPRRISADLQQAGLSNQMIREAMEAAECDWTELARQAHDKRFGSAATTSLNERMKRQRFLFGRGFDSEQVRAAIQGATETD